MANKFSSNSVLPCLMIFLCLRKFLTGVHHPADPLSYQPRGNGARAIANHHNSASSLSRDHCFRLGGRYKSGRNHADHQREADEREKRYEAKED
jgi:hypothetical protein